MLPQGTSLCCTCIMGPCCGHRAWYVAGTQSVCPVSWCHADIGMPCHHVGAGTTPACCVETEWAASPNAFSLPLFQVLKILMSFGCPHTEQLANFALCRNDATVSLSASVWSLTNVSGNRNRDLSLFLSRCTINEVIFILSIYWDTYFLMVRTYHFPEWPVIYKLSKSNFETGIV